MCVVGCFCSNELYDDDGKCVLRENCSQSNTPLKSIQPRKTTDTPLLNYLSHTFPSTHTHTYTHNTHTHMHTHSQHIHITHQTPTHTYNTHTRTHTRTHTHTHTHIYTQSSASYSRILVHAVMGQKCLLTTQSLEDATNSLTEVVSAMTTNLAQRKLVWTCALYNAHHTLDHEQ